MEISTIEFANLSDEDLRKQLSENGIPYGPIVASTRKIYEKKLALSLGAHIQSDESALEMNGNANLTPTNGISMNGINATNGVSMNGNGLSRENSPVNSTIHSECTVDEGISGLTRDTIREISPILPVDDDGSDDEHSEESARLLTHQEIFTYQNNIIRRSIQNKSNNKIDLGASNERFQPTMANLQKHRPAKRYAMPIVLVLGLGLMLAVVFKLREQFYTTIGGFIPEKSEPGDDQL